MEPPAPVTSTRRPEIWSAMAVVSRCTGRRPRRSATSRSRRSFGVGRPPMMSLSGGRLTTSRPASAARDAKSRRVAASALGSASTRVSASYFSATAASASRVPRTRRPSRRRRCLDGSSSRSATGTKEPAPSYFMLRRRRRPASPAPRMIALRSAGACMARYDRSGRGQLDDLLEGSEHVADRVGPDEVADDELPDHGREREVGRASQETVVELEVEADPEGREEHDDPDQRVDGCPAEADPPSPAYLRCHPVLTTIPDVP